MQKRSWVQDIKDAFASHQPEERNQLDAAEMQS